MRSSWPRSWRGRRRRYPPPPRPPRPRRAPPRAAPGRAGARGRVGALARQSATPGGDPRARDDSKRLLRGLGEPEPIHVPPGGTAVGRSLAELDLRAVTGATVLAIARG